MLLAAATVARAFSFSYTTQTGQTLYFTIVTSNTVKIVAPSDYHDWEGYNKPTGRMEIPATVNHQGTDFSVVSIDNKAFTNCKNLKSVRIPSTVEVIGLRAFANDTALTSLVLEEGVLNIDNMAFAECVKLDTIVLPSSLTRIGSQAFNGTAYYNNTDNWDANYSLVIGQWLIETANTVSGEVVVHDDIVGVANRACYYCRYMRGITLPSTVRYIGESAFLDCSQLDSVRLGATEPPVLGADAFAGLHAAIQVPCGSLQAYSEATAWSSLNLVEKACPSLPLPRPLPHPNPHLAIGQAENHDTVTYVVADGGVWVNHAEGETVTLCDLCGRCVATVNVASDHQFLPMQAQGVYVLRFKDGYTKRIVYLK